MKKVIEFVKRMRKVQEEVGVALKKVQEEMRRQVDREKQEVEKWRKGEKVMLSIKDLVFKERLAKKLDRKICGAI